MAPLVRHGWPRSSRIRPANDREMSRNDGDGWSIESAGREPDSGIAAGSEISPENTLKVETRVQIPMGLPVNPKVRGTARRCTDRSAPGFLDANTPTTDHASCSSSAPATPGASMDRSRVPFRMAASRI